MRVVTSHLEDAIAALRLGLPANSSIRCEISSMPERLAGGTMDLPTCKEIIDLLKEAMTSSTPMALALCEDAYSLVLR